MTEVVEVATDPMTAFTTFTDEFDQWWGRGPIDAYDTWRLTERRIEGGVGGRLVEDYGDEVRYLGAPPPTRARPSSPSRHARGGPRSGRRRRRVGARPPHRTVRSPRW